MLYAHHLVDAVWRKSQRSNGNGGNNCVEVAFLAGAVAVRDSKEPDGPALLFTDAEWTSFVGGVHDGEFDREALP
ncbi:DUF397 domain-containing protein [Actinoplanes sp. TBRC 11911]|uniref:DUF397 domain-containing protein n=1 Tax=Actinoplanes sp. TBRC 11911 TaxID=2729386 RepID=UPI00145D6174|nr:DUF397 domain-containing protein [Actinoplanes sp. TBRC 11911]NMO57700.1 DUF397 domain-containing protein [Actinoplanes sp. TBRC 11911]